MYKQTGKLIWVVLSQEKRTTDSFGLLKILIRSMGRKTVKQTTRSQVQYLKLCIPMDGHWRLGMKNLRHFVREAIILSRLWVWFSFYPPPRIVDLVLVDSKKMNTYLRLSRSNSLNQLELRCEFSIHVGTEMRPKILGFSCMSQICTFVWDVSFYRLSTAVTLCIFL